MDQSMSSASIMNDTITATANSSNPAAMNAADASWQAPTQVVVSAIEFYVPVWCVGFLLYCYLRRKCPRVFAVRQWVPAIQTSLADNQFGTLSWLWKVYSVFDSDDLRSEIGLDALCFLRLITFGFRLSVVGCINSVWLLPMYAAAARMLVLEENESRDALSDVSINALGDGVDRRYYIGTVVASYVLYGYAMYAILGEFQWFVRQRHAWLQQLRPQNYTILVRNIPKHLRSNVTLREHFQRLYGADRVYEVHVCVFVSELQSLVQRRESCVAKLEQVVIEQELNQRHQLVLASSDTVRESLIQEIQQLNRQITQQIAKIERKGRPRMMGAGTVFRSSNRGSLSPAMHQNLLPGISNSRSSSSSEGDYSIDEESVNNEEDDEENQDVDDENETNDDSNKQRDDTNTSIEQWDAIVSTATNTRYKKTKWQMPKTTVKAAVHKASKAVAGAKDGKHDDAGFVTFTSLVAMHGALQMKQHPDLFAMETEIAPEPSEIFWNFVGSDREVLQSGRLISIALTVTLCLFWTFVVTFIVNLTDTDRLVKFLPWSAEFLEGNESFTKFLNSLSPVLLLLFNSGLLPIILKAVSRFECPASDSMLESMAFWKMAAFIVIQSFFVSLVSESLVEQLNEVFNDPSNFVSILATELPNRGAYFMRLLIVSACIGTLVELYRAVPLIQCTIRLSLGHRATEKQRSEAIGPFKPLCVVDKFYFSRIQARILLYFMVLFVYSSISPVVNWLCFIFFLFLGSVYRHQFIFNYPKTPDSGGHMWIMFMAVILACMVIAQVTLWGLLGIRQAMVAVSMMIPLMVITGIFIVYLVQHYFWLGKYLPAHCGLSQDLDNAEAGVDFSHFRDLYKNPVLKAQPVDVEQYRSTNATPPTIARKYPIKQSDDSVSQPTSRESSKDSGAS